MGKQLILPADVAERFTVDPKAPVRFIHRFYGEYDLRNISLKAAEFLSSKGVYLKPKEKEAKKT